MCYNTHVITQIVPETCTLLCSDNFVPMQQQVLQYLEAHNKNSLANLIAWFLHDADDIKWNQIYCLFKRSEIFGDY